METFLAGELKEMFWGEKVETLTDKKNVCGEIKSRFSKRLGSGELKTLIGVTLVIDGLREMFLLVG